MKYLVVLVVVLGFACGREEEDLGLQDVDVGNEFAEIYSMVEGRQTTLDPALIIGNIISAIGNINITDPNSIVNDILDALKITGASTATIGSIGAIGGIKSVFDLIVTSIIGLVSVPLSIANSILALVGLVILIIFLIDGGDFGSLLGVARASNVWNFMPENLVDNAFVEGVSSVFFDAMEKFENFNL